MKNKKKKLCPQKRKDSIPFKFVHDIKEFPSRKKPSPLTLESSGAPLV